MDRSAPDLPPGERRQQVERESAAILGFVSAIAAYGAFYVPRAYGPSIDATGTADVALWSFPGFCLTCALLTWSVYSGPRGILRNVGRRQRRDQPRRA